MKYKVGDEVLVKARIMDLNNSRNHKYKVKSADNKSPDDMARHIYIRGEDIVPVPDTTAEEAWEIAKKLFADYSNAELDDIFGKGWSFPQLMEMTPHEAKTKIKAWEAEKEIKVGDEVEFDGEIGVVTKTDGAEGFYSLLFKNGETGAYQAKRLKKTGRHIDIDGLLKQIGGDE